MQKRRVRRRRTGAPEATAIGSPHTQPSCAAIETANGQVAPRLKSQTAKMHRH